VTRPVPSLGEFEPATLTLDGEFADGKLTVTVDDDNGKGSYDCAFTGTVKNDGNGSSPSRLDQSAGALRIHS
jgi:hypothetical protein